MRRPTRKTKIICTLGPASKSVTTLKAMIDAGLDIARINFSHGDHSSNEILMTNLRQASQESGIPVALLADIQGPKIRLGSIVSESLTIQPGDKIHFAPMKDLFQSIPGNGTENAPIEISYKQLCSDLKKNHRLLIDDGSVEVEVINVTKSSVECAVVNGLSISSRKGVHFPDSNLSTHSITEKDWSDIQFAIDNKFDFLALSFVRSHKEIKNIKTFLSQNNSPIEVIAKIEQAEALEDIENIMEHAHGILVARGDLALEIGNEGVPLKQKELTHLCRKFAKPCIIATQMLMNMVEHPNPTRAEASDIANAVFDQVDAVMLSNETTVGNFPVLSVSTMEKIICKAESNLHILPERRLRDSHDPGLKRVSQTEAIEKAATSLAETLNSIAVGCLTRSGRSARLLVKHRPALAIFAFTTNDVVARQLLLLRGVFVVPWQAPEANIENYKVFDHIMQTLKRRDLINEGESIVFTGGIPSIMHPGSTNTITIKKYDKTIHDMFNLEK